MRLEIQKAVRKAVPILIGIYGPTGSGKTLSALLLASGLAPTKKVVLIDSEPPRARIHADNPRAVNALPDGFDVIDLDAPYEPKRFVEAIDLCESRGYEVCIIDSLTDAWSGVGGCEDMKEQTKSWNKPKLENKRMRDRIKATRTMHVICCFKAHEKTVIVEGEINPKTGKPKQEYKSLGMQAETEKNNLFPLLIVFSVDADTHLATAKKVTPEPLQPAFNEPRLLRPEDGLLLRKWNDSAPSEGGFDQLAKRAKAEALNGVEAYRRYFQSLTKKQKAWLVKHGHEDNKFDAEQTDLAAQGVEQEQPEEDEV